MIHLAVEMMTLTRLLVKGHFLVMADRILKHIRRVLQGHGLTKHQLLFTNPYLTYIPAQLQPDIQSHVGHLTIVAIVVAQPAVIVVMVVGIQITFIEEVGVKGAVVLCTTLVIQ